MLQNNNLLDYDNYDDFETSIELLKESEVFYNFSIY